MSSEATDLRPTHIMVVSDVDIELAEVHSMMGRVHELLRPISLQQRRLLGDALLNLAVGIKVRESGVPSTAEMLVRLIDSVVEGVPPGRVELSSASHYA
jgi:hypothetical protein